MHGRGAQRPHRQALFRRLRAEGAVADKRAGAGQSAQSYAGDTGRRGGKKMFGAADGFLFLHAEADEGRKGAAQIVGGRKVSRK